MEEYERNIKILINFNDLIFIYIVSDFSCFIVIF